MNVVLLVSTLLFFSPVEGAQMCYVCDDPQCEDVKEQTCEMENFMCRAWSYTKAGETVHLRQCLTNSDELRKVCYDANEAEGTSCSACNKDLCNKQAKQPWSESVENGVFLELAHAQKCYTCIGRCEDPKELICVAEDFLCEIASSTEGGITVTTRQCVPNTVEAHEICVKWNAKKNTKCYTCEEDLCNDKFPSRKGSRHGDAAKMQRNATHSASAKTYSAPTMLLAILVSLLMAKL